MAVNTAATAASPLFRLSRELRDEIYKYAVVEEVIILQGTSIAEPGLLQVSKQVRAETTPIFYNRCDFLAEVRDYDFSNLKRSHVRLRKYARLFVTNLEYNAMGMIPHWPNLLCFLEDTHRDWRPNINMMIGDGTGFGAEEVVLDVLFSLVRRLRGVF
ncbi:uncharacterized protein LTR77_004248 [Saxophila tyrrhenica]|uniref:Uncharacterized protein n=1 Tax=Saxophila tyrrhenica TaxID=1690608 RepID=A0AAV9PCF2_9PEZI|nr:hypothetical protein LTR77_004248 [Saxophila tyrrhenica]